MVPMNTTQLLMAEHNQEAQKKTSVISGSFSPRSQNLVESISEVLQFHDYSLEDCHALVQRCDYSEETLMAAVEDIT